MINTLKVKQFDSIHAIFNYYVAKSFVFDDDNQLVLLYAIVDYLRPKKPRIVQIVDIQELIDHLSAFEDHRIFFRNYLNQIFDNRKFSRMMSDIDILQESDFLYEVKRRFWNKILPFQPAKESLEYVLNQIFFKATDDIWLEKIPEQQLISLLNTLQLPTIYDSPSYSEGAVSEILFTIGLLSQRMSGRSMESHIIYMVPEYTHLESPFLAFEREFLQLEKQLRSGQIKFLNSSDINYKQLIVLLRQCVDYINQAFKNKERFGITLRVNQNLLRLRQQLRRVDLMLKYLLVDNHADKMYNTIALYKTLVKFNGSKNQVSSLISESIENISYQITQYTGRTGEHYITVDKKGYWKMFKGALGGGLIVGILCVIKVLMSKAETSDFGFAFLYSLNYALGFILIYLLGFTLATKQPAMTASYIAQSIVDGQKNSSDRKIKYYDFAVLFARLSRSQFIAFVGNVIMAFPVSLAIIFAFDYFTGVNITDTKWHKLLNDVNPILSPAIFHAAIAGVFLFLSGLISGNVANRDLHAQINYRIKEHPILKRTFGIQKTEKIANWIQKKWPGIISNFWFGVFMGSTHSVGNFLGLNLDIRHITFASGNIALGAYGADFQVPVSVYVWSVIGLVIIGFVNFMVSFMLSLYLAFKSRKLPVKELIPLFKSVFQHFKNRPWLFFFPPLKTQKK